jgi:uncharacterized membrane protein (DUF106 family)
MSPQIEDKNKPLPVFYTNWRVRALGLAGFGLALVGTVSATFSLNSTEVIIGQVTLLFVPILAVVLGAVPIIVTLAVIGFILGLLSVILKKIEI